MFSDWIEVFGFRWRRNTSEPEKPSEQGENQQTQPTYDAGSKLLLWEASVLTVAPNKECYTIQLQ